MQIGVLEEFILIHWVGVNTFQVIWTLKAAANVADTYKFPSLTNSVATMTCESISKTNIRSHVPEMTCEAT